MTYCRIYIFFNIELLPSHFVFKPLRSLDALRSLESSDWMLCLVLGATSQSILETRVMTHESCRLMVQTSTPVAAFVPPRYDHISIWYARRLTLRVFVLE